MPAAPARSLRRASRSSSSASSRRRGRATSTLRGRLGGAPWATRIAVAEAARGADGTAQPVLGHALGAPPHRRARSARAPTAPAAAAVEETSRSRSASSSSRAYTSFVAVERELLRRPALPLAQVLVPNELPEGVSYEGIFGRGREVEVAARAREARRPRAARVGAADAASR